VVTVSAGNGNTVTKVLAEVSIQPASETTTL